MVATMRSESRFEGNPIGYGLDTCNGGFENVLESFSKNNSDILSFQYEWDIPFHNGICIAPKI